MVVSLHKINAHVPDRKWDKLKVARQHTEDGSLTIVYNNLVRYLMN